MSKKAKNIIKIVLISLLVLAYPIYAIIVWNISKSPSDLSEFPKSGVWVCSEQNFVITIDLSSEEAHEYPIENMQILIEFGGETQVLSCYQMPGHGTMLVPVAPSKTLTFESRDLQAGDNNYIDFSTHKYKFNKNDFYLLDISISENNQVNFLKQNMDLHFIKQN